MRITSVYISPTDFAESGALDYLLAEKATGELTLQKIIVEWRRGGPYRSYLACAKKETSTSPMKHRVTVDDSAVLP
jgi:hypothetical protein